MTNGADHMSQDGSPFHDPRTLIKNNKNESCDYRIYSINCHGRLLKFLDLDSGRLFEVGAYSRLGAY